MLIEEAGFLSGFLWLAERGAEAGWHEANGGNLSYRLAEGESDAFGLAPAGGMRRTPLNIHVPALAGCRIAITATGSHMDTLFLAPDEGVGIVEIDGAGSSYAVVAGFDGSHATSELAAHLAVHDALLRAGRKQRRVVYHSHCPHVVALSAVLEADVRTWTSTLWRTLSECVVAVPSGIAALPYLAPGSTTLAQETAKAFAHHDACAWANHGLMVAANEFDEAFDVAESIEKAARIYLAARAACGGREPNHLIPELALRTYCTQSGIPANLDLLD